MPQGLLPRTRALLARCDQPLREIAEGAGVGFDWLRKFKQKAVAHDYGVGKVQALHDYLERQTRVSGRNRLRA